MRKYACFCEFCIEQDLCEFGGWENIGHVKQWRYASLTSKGTHPIPTWKEMHTKETVVFLDPYQVCDMIREGRWSFIRVSGFIKYITYFYFDSKIIRSNFKLVFMCVCV